MEPLVLLHAFPVDASLWAPQLSALGDRPVLAPDFPGFGGRPPGPTDLDGFADGIVEQMDERGFRTAVVLGLSMGGYVALRIWARHPDRVSALILADTRAGPDLGPAAERRALLADRVRREGTGWLADAMLPDLLARNDPGRDAREARVREMVSRADPEGVARALLAMRSRPDSTPLLENITIPVLALVGELDSVTPIEEARKIADAVPHGSLEILPDAGHLSNLDAPDAFASAVGRFLVTTR